HCRFIAATRPGYDPAMLAERLPQPFVAAIDLLTGPGVEISSSDIRRRIQEGVSARYLTPEPVLDYIRKRRLYAG
ncbi:MAG TPA: nicotinic acid mononucleotide adenylyltransferase, partial [Armatimonadota bacterium]|nr:nicotinic acid mononucleotide adenylyltransferase [Armatimonadota bacterium]